MKTNPFQSVIRYKETWILVLTIISLCFISMVTYEATKASVQLTENGKSGIIRTHSNTVGDLLTELEIKVKPNDELSHKLTEPVSYGMDIQYIASKSLSIAIDEQPAKTYHTTAATVGEFFVKEGLSFQERDLISHSKPASIKNDMHITVRQAIPVVIDDGGVEKEVWTTASTVEEVLNEQKITLSPLDELKPALNETLTADLPVHVTRVEKVTDYKDKKIDYSVETRKDDSLPKGEKRTLRYGEDGLITQKFEVTLKNGEVAARELLEETVEKESRNQVVAIGTKTEKVTKVSETDNADLSRRTASQSAPKSTIQTENSKKPSNRSTYEEVTAASRDSQSNKEETLYMHATAYTAQCTGCSGVTATGINLNGNPDKKVVAVDPDVIPLGSRVWVEGYGYAVAGDTGGAINGKRIDLFVPDKEQALSFGRQQVKVKVLD
ncbi:G5 and 3D domain-containing protein [Halobacillus halophilus]|uniref:G5 and 3D domain-containing protein n=1 Tax=Halobacillus halophilus TaxID=1570 RepID=UPI001CD3B8FB|nr:G5 and 3D domain-containing protein [Halobacillus halophilus]MCA1012966.1 ubiquitin-like domain-containing protein [Halobacillus halophilus]